MVYERGEGDDRCLIVLNPTSRTAQVTLPPSPQGIPREPRLIGGNYKRCTYRQSRKGDLISISAFSAAIYKL